jgi:hypothetical protein
MVLLIQANIDVRVRPVCTASVMRNMRTESIALLLQGHPESMEAVGRGDDPHRKPLLPAPGDSYEVSIRRVQE